MRSGAKRSRLLCAYVNLFFRRIAYERQLVLEEEEEEEELARRYGAVLDCRRAGSSYFVSEKQSIEHLEAREEYSSERNIRSS